MAMPAIPTADFILIEADFLFGLLKTLLDRPTDTGYLNQGLS